jgi:hypothetical protein
MSTVGRHRTPTIQLELPLRSPPAKAAPAAPRHQADWHLDEHTRRIGRQGVAAARALLEDGARTVEDTAVARLDGDTGGGHRKAGRAA